jgi:hypothetical protein
MAVEIKPLNLAELIGNVEAIKSARANREHQDYQMQKERRLSDILASTDLNKPEGVNAVMRENPTMGMQLRGQQIQQQQQQQQFKEHELKGLGRLAATAVEAYQQHPDQWDQIKQSLLPDLDKMGLSQHAEGFLNSTPENAMMAAKNYAQWQSPQEQLAQKQAEYQAMTGPAVERARLEAEAKSQYQKPAQPKLIATNEGYVDQQDVLANPGKYKTPQQAEKYQKREAEKTDAISNIDDTIADFQELKAIQGRTITGPIAGSAPVALLRKMGPNSLTGGDDLQRLEKGYNNLAIKAIGAFKAGGVTFGQLSNKEGEWIRSTQAALNTGGEINQEMLDKGLKLLEDRKRRLANSGGLSATAPSSAPSSKYQLGQTATGQNGVKMVYTEQGWQKQ